MSESAIVAWAGSIKASVKTIRVLVNNAAWDPRIPFLETTAQQWDDLFALNLRAYFLMARECAPAMTRGSSIVNISSVTFYNTPTKMVAYVATKGGVIGFTRCLARELGEHGVRVNCISPGWVFTELGRFNANMAFSAADRDTCLAVGMDAHLAKPVDARQLVLTLLRHARPGTKLQAQLAPALQEVDDLLDLLIEKEKELKATLAAVGPYATILSNVIGTGPWFDAYVFNLAAIPTGEFQPGLLGE